MNIVFLSRRFYPQIGGVETHVLEISKILAKQGNRITVITEDNKKGIALELQSEEQDKLEKIKIVKINSRGNNWFKKFRIWNEIWQYRSVFVKADIIHCHDVFFWYLPFKLIYPSKKVYTTFHGYETKFPPSKKAILVRKISEKLSNGNICVGEYIKNWYGTKPNYVTYGGVINNNYFNESHTKNKVQIDIVFIGRMQKDLGVRTYLKSLQLLNTKNINYKFESYGDGELRLEMEKYGKSNKFTNDVYRAIQKADIVFCSSYLTMLQALITKKIVIGVYENKLKEDYLKNSPFAKYIYICSSEKELIRLIEQIYLEPWKSISMVNNGYEWAVSQTWGNVVGIYLNLWRI